MKLPADAATEILNSTSEAVVVVDTDGRIVFANRQAAALFGYAIGELSGNAIEMLIPEALRRGHERQRRGYHKSPHSRPLVSGLHLQGMHKDGRTFDVEIALTPVSSDEGDLVASSIRAVGAGNATESFFRNLLDAAPDAMVILDGRGRIAIVNGQAEKMFGYRRKEMVGRHVEMLLPERFRERHIAHRTNYNDNPRLREMGLGMELAGLRSDGTEFPVEISLSPIPSAAGSFVASVIRDVTERHRMQHELVSARQAAERANKANTAFLAAASHDLRQPVQALNLLSGALRRTVKNELALEMIESQQESLDAMTSLLNSLLDISRLDAGAVEPEIEEFSVRRLIDRLSAEFSRQAGHKGLHFEAEPCDVVIRSDPNLLGEIIQNFVSNAIRYTDRGRVSLTCTRQDGKLRIAVSDTGIGIEADQFENIFREFHQIKSAAPKNAGFGLGLAITRRLADLLTHEISVESSPGVGSCFSVFVPMLRAEPRQATAKRGAASTDAAPPGLVILVEDDVKVAKAWGLLLRAEGYRVAVAASAGEARSVVRGLKDKPQLIISDFHLMDEANGVEAIAGIRQEVDACVPAFIVTGDTSKVVLDAEKLENSLLMSKPISTDRLLELARVAIVTGRVPD